LDAAGGQQGLDDPFRAEAARVERECGFQIAFYVLAGLAAAGALISVLMLEPRPAQPERQRASEAFQLEEA
jgi:hypothetical protein